MDQKDMNIKTNSPSLSKGTNNVTKITKSDDTSQSKQQKSNDPSKSTDQKSSAK
jgi:hypothetical protein